MELCTEMWQEGKHFENNNKNEKVFLRKKENLLYVNLNNLLPGIFHTKSNLSYSSNHAPHEFTHSTVKLIDTI